MDLRYSIIEYFGPQTPDSYNKYFHPNICHVCKSIQSIKPCKQCHKITYCSDAHKLLDEPQHKVMCEVITKVLREIPKQTQYHLNLLQWWTLQKIFLDRIKENMERSLDKYEMQMILVAKSCFICHQQDTLRSCNVCFSAYFCDNHREEFDANHGYFCRGLLLYLNLCISTINVNAQSLYQLKIQFSTFPDSNKFFDNTLSFLNQYVRNKQDDILSLEDYFYSECISGPLTLYYGMKEAGLLNLLLPDIFNYQVSEVREEIVCTIHIISATIEDKKSLSAWELLLHLLDNIKKLIIVMIGRPLQHEVGRHDIYCDICSYYGREIIFECHSMPYHEYVTSPLYRRPNVIMGFLDFYLFQPLADTMKMLQLQFCPIIITARSITKLQENIQNIIGTTITPLYYAENRFCSLKPYKLFMSDSVFYRHKYLIIF